MKKIVLMVLLIVSVGLIKAQSIVPWYTDPSNAGYIIPKTGYAISPTSMGMFSITDTGSATGFYRRAYVDALVNALQAKSDTVNQLRKFTILLLNGAGTDSSNIMTTLNIPMGISSGIVIDTIIYVQVSGSSPSVVPSICYGSDISAAGTTVINSPSAVTSNTTSTKIATFDNRTIPSGAMIWLSFPTVTTKPKLFYAFIKGHRL